jgi:hypothetical protein
MQQARPAEPRLIPHSHSHSTFNVRLFSQGSPLVQLGAKMYTLHV